MKNHSTHKYDEICSYKQNFQKYALRNRCRNFQILLKYILIYCSRLNKVFFPFIKENLSFSKNALKKNGFLLNLIFQFKLSLVNIQRMYLFIFLCVLVKKMFVLYFIYKLNT